MHHNALESCGPLTSEQQEASNGSRRLSVVGWAPMHSFRILRKTLPLTLSLLPLSVASCMLKARSNLCHCQSLLGTTHWVCNMRSHGRRPFCWTLNTAWSQAILIRAYMKNQSSTLFSSYKTPCFYTSHQMFKSSMTSETIAIVGQSHPANKLALNLTHSVRKGRSSTVGQGWEFTAFSQLSEHTLNEADL